MSENQLIFDNHLLVCIQPNIDAKDVEEYEYLKSHFCGGVLCANEENLDQLDLIPQSLPGTIFVCGDVQLFRSRKREMVHNVKVVKELSFNVEGSDNANFVTLGEVPINLHNAAVYYRDCLGSLNSQITNYFDSLQDKHKFQALTESNKPGKSFRKGIYLSEVEVEGDTSKFNLLRCSTNFEGPTLAFSEEDREILTHLNKLADENFVQKANLNHVLAQLYTNTLIVDDSNKTKERKAKIRNHSDKTKDMPANGLIAFCTFYSSDINKYKASPHDRFDRRSGDASVLTRLKFRLKDEAHQLPLVRKFVVPLYHNSILLIPLSTNRYWTHEICPPALPVGKFPTRIGYVVRCSKTKAVFRDGSTFIMCDGKEDVKLAKPTHEGIDELKKLYQAENITTNHIVYKDIFFSLNEGDYKQPIVE